MDTRHGSHETALTVGTLSGLTRRFAGLVETADMTLAVPSCPEWSVEDLVRHIGSVHQWAVGSIGARAGANMPVADDIPRARLASWYRQRAAELVDRLERVGPDAPAWVFGPQAGEGRASFWIRRQIHETVVHTWDLRAAHGIDEVLEPVLAWDGVEEVGDVFYPRQVALGRIAPLPDSLRLTATDLVRPAVVLGSGDPIAVELPASDMLLGLWHRITPLAHDHRAAELVGRALTP